MEYDKPHLALSQQVEKLASNGLQILDRDRAARLLETVGYYRVSAYAYPFRELLGERDPRDTSVQFRSNAFIAGAQFSWIEDMWRFDRELRLLVLDAIETVEIALRSKVGYHLGLRHKFGCWRLDTTSDVGVERTSRCSSRVVRCGCLVRRPGAWAR